MVIKLHVAPTLLQFTVSLRHDGPITQLSPYFTRNPCTSHKRTCTLQWNKSWAKEVVIGIIGFHFGNCPEKMTLGEGLECLFIVLCITYNRTRNRDRKITFCVRFSSSKVFLEAASQIYVTHFPSEKWKAFRRDYPSVWQSDLTLLSYWLWSTTFSEFLIFGTFNRSI